MGKTNGQISGNKGKISENQSSSSRTVKRNAKKSKSLKSYDFDSKKNILSSLNVVHNLDKFQHGELSSDIFKSYGENFISEKLKAFDVYAFEKATIIRRVTALKFHPKEPWLFSVGDKNGGLTLKVLKGEEKEVSWGGTGPGGSITSICFDPFTPDCILTSSIDGTVRKKSYGVHKCQVLLDTGSFSKWYCSVNASESTGLVVSGDTNGILTILNKEYSPVSTYKLHKGKINTIEFCKNRSWLMATASLDRTVKIWDLRKIESKTPLNILSHKCPINAAYFSEVNGNRLLTTDQHSELRVYKAPQFNIETLINHPHRQFQHLTPIRACWYPLTDLIAVGRYPDPNWPSYSPGELRSVDILSARTGEIKAQMFSVSCKGIISLNSFNSTGEIMASGMGQYVAYWKLKQSRDRLKESEKRKKSGDGSSDDDHPPAPRKIVPRKSRGVMSVKNSSKKKV